MKIAIIGVGNLVYSLALGILSEDNVKFDSLFLSKRNTKTPVIKPKAKVVLAAEAVPLFQNIPHKKTAAIGGAIEATSHAARGSGR